MRKIILRRIVFSLCFLAVAGSLVPFVLSWRPNSKAEVALPHIEVASVGPGQYRLHAIHLPGSGFPYGWGALIVRRENGDLDVWDMLIGHQGVVGMPDVTWFRVSRPCSKFGPSENFGSTHGDVTIECWDPDVPEYWRREFRWTLDGESLGRDSPNMMRIEGEVIGGDFVVNG